jgi:DNA repair protein RadC
MLDMYRLEQEELWVLLLDTRGRLIHTHKVYKGSLNMSLIRLGEVFLEAIIRNANSMIAVHNHPSGDPDPGPEDISLTRALRKAGKLLDIEVLDHIIIGAGEFVSLARRGHLSQ